MYISVNGRQTVVAASDTKFRIVGGDQIIKVSGARRNVDKIVGKKLYNGGFVMHLPAKPFSELRVAVVCNWNDKCGISTYSKYLVSAMIPLVKELHVFSEFTKDQTDKDEAFVTRCWRRGENLKEMLKALMAWKPDFIVIQHEYGIFPNACHFFQMMQTIDEIPYIVTMHSIYDHLDKAVYSSVVQHIVVHSEPAKECLLSKGNTSDIYVIPHGCVLFPEAKELWNIMQNPYTILQFGFGFRYKGVERMLEAIRILKHTRDDQKYKNIFYTFLLSTNTHNSRMHTEYYDSLIKKCKELDIDDNVVIIRKYNSDQTLNLFLRLYKLAVFPYISSNDNIVFGATGAARVAMGNGIPVVCSEAHLFDDLEGIAPRPDSAEALAKEIDHMFTDWKYRKTIIDREKAYMEANAWPIIAGKYLDCYTAQCK